MISHEDERDEKYETFREFKDFVHRKQKELHIIFENLKTKNIIEILTENYRKCLLLESQTFESLENIEKTFKELSDFLKKESEKIQLDKNLKKGLELMLEWYRIRSIEISLRPKAMFLSYPRTKEEEKKEDTDKKNEFIKKIENTTEDVRNFNQNLRKMHKEYKIKLALDFSCNDLQTLFEPLVTEENVFENKIENSSFFKSYQSEREMLIKRVTKLDIELLQRIQVFTRSRDEARKIRLEKINAFLGTKDTYRVDVYYLQQFYETKEPSQKQIVDAYKKINEKNLRYERIRELKSETDKLDIPLKAFLLDLSSYALSYLETGYYYIQSGYPYLEAINKIATLLKTDSDCFSKNAKILEQMRECEEEYQYFEKYFPEDKKNVEKQYIEVASQYTKEIYNKKLIDLKMFESQERANRRKEIHDFIQPFKLKVTLDDVDPIRFKELHRKKLDDTWKNVFTVILKKTFEIDIKDFQTIKKNSSKSAALRCAKQLREKLLQKKSRIFLQCINGLDVDKKENIQLIYDETFIEILLVKDVHAFIQETEKKLVENEIKRKTESPPPSKWMRVLNFFWKAALFLKRLFMCCKGPDDNRSKKLSLPTNVELKPVLKTTHAKIPFKPIRPLKEISNEARDSEFSVSNPRSALSFPPRHALRRDGNDKEPQKSPYFQGF